MNASLLWLQSQSNKGSKVYRNGPDVAANANFTFYVCADQQACTSNLYGGTSFAAPMWAGYLALANEQAASKGDKPPGFINPGSPSILVQPGRRREEVRREREAVQIRHGHNLNSGPKILTTAHLRTAASKNH